MSKRMPNRLLLLLFGCIFIFTNLQAKKVPGYIITNNGDTIFGEIKVSSFDLFTSGIVINGIDLEPFYFMVGFRESGKWLCKTYEPEDLMGFEFLFDKLIYRFERHKIKSKSIIKNDEERIRFLNLVFKGECSIYRDVIRRPTDLQSIIPNPHAHSIVHYDYYLYNEKRGLKKVVRTKDCTTVIELLTLYEVDREYLKRLSPQIQFRDIRKVLLDYENWKRSQIIRV